MASNIDTSYFDNLTAQVNAIQGPDACAELQALANEAMASLQANVTAIEAQIAALAPLLSIPHDLGSCISWITSAIAPHQTASNSYIAQLTATLTAIGKLASAIEAAAARITSCSVTVPPVS